ncbi:MAG: phosphoglycolate phosphatase [Paracoccus sp. (in: a-proteobacteria)]|jgi:phosphoglycolate phosphatase|uniref:phosphoglycolate phosphatase n=3 Tax=Paracoccus TaxID=265 RepID=UPI0025E14F34|nr:MULTISPECIES: phosphoglycolate phosphatase [unclassified Paracoccus (in: a-proteobacteria)]|tara:strand:+ start:7765 stop:8469 length:705 start_codon:yes stop_codon:yes gene_type:complete
MFDQVEIRMNVCMAPCPIVFDLDGTLIDSAPDIHACVNAVLRQNRLAPLGQDRVRSFIGGGVDLLWTRIIAALRIDPAYRSDLIASFMTRYHDATALTRLFPGVVEALGTLADRGHPLGICTNKPMGPTRAILDHFGIAGSFAHVTSGDCLPQKKPDPAPLRAALAALGADPAQPRAIYVGDSEFDARCAAAIQVPFLIYTKGYRLKPVADLPHDAAFDDFAALPALIETRVMV